MFEIDDVPLTGFICRRLGRKVELTSRKFKAACGSYIEYKMLAASDGTIEDRIFVGNQCKGSSCSHCKEMDERATKIIENSIVKP